MLRKILGENSIGKRGFLVITILFLSVFGWYYMTLPLLDKILNGLEIGYAENLSIWATFYLSIIGTSILGTFLSKKVGRMRFLYIWTIIGVISSLLPALLIDFTFWQVWIVYLLLGSSFGLGVPLCLAYFADCTSVENRGRIGGITFLLANLSVPFLAILFSMFDLAVVSIFFSILRGMGLIVFFQTPEKQPSSLITTSVSFISILRDRTFQLYFIAWSMFPLVDSFERVLVDAHLLELESNILETMAFVEPLVAALSILIAGLLCDWIGRKKIILSGFVTLGVAYAMIAFFNQFNVIWYLYFIVDGIAWGIFLLTFVLILWGDLAQSSNSEKYYTIGSIPFILSSIIPSLFTKEFVKDVQLVAAFSVASFFLFVAVMPLVFAPETLPEKKMELRRLRSFADEARKAREKYERKSKD